jgi:outer membrane protein OmpA-like peptidoglycan-associated protein
MAGKAVPLGSVPARRDRAGGALVHQATEGTRLQSCCYRSWGGIRPDFLPTLERVADVLAEDGGTRVLVVGHTDAVGSAGYNRELSLARAEAVRDALATYGVDPDRVRAEGRGEAEPRAGNDSEADREANRRVEILISSVA